MSPLNIKSLADLERRRTPDIYELAELPKIVQWTSYAKAKANAISSLVREMYGSSYEWYGFTIAHNTRPQLIVDIGLPENARNDPAYTRIEPEQIGRFCDRLSDDYLINGWIHSHGRMGVFFSGTDDRNHVSVLDFVTTELKIPVRKQEVLAESLSMLVEGEFSKSDMKDGTLTVITDTPVGKAKVLETIMGGFAYGMVIVDSGYTGQVIYYKYTSMLTQQEKVTFRPEEKTGIRTLQVEYPFGLEQKVQLMREVKKKIKPDFFGGIWNRFRSPTYPVKTYKLNGTDTNAAETKPVVLIPATLPTAGQTSKAYQATLDDAVTPTPDETAVDVNQLKNELVPADGVGQAADPNLQQPAAKQPAGPKAGAENSGSVEQQYKSTADGQAAASKIDDNNIGNEKYDRIGDKSGLDNDKLENQ